MGYSFVMAKISMSEEAMNAAVINELCSGRQFMQSLEEMRERNSAQIAQQYRGTKSKGDLMHIGEIPQHEYFKMMQWHGEDCWSDREFVRHVQKTHPHLFSHKV